MTTRTCVTYHQFRYTTGHAAGKIVTLRAFDRGCSWVDIVLGDGNPDDLNRNITSDAAVIACARLLAGHGTWVVEGFGSNSDHFPSKVAAVQQLRLIVEDNLGGKFI